MASTYDVVIIGGGLGGLECGYILSKKGLNVCIVEKERQIGGCLQTFRRNGRLFDTGFHYVGGLQNGQGLYRLFDYFNLLNLPWYQMDEDGYEEVFWEGESYMHASGHERFVETLAAHFPQERSNLQKYADFLKGVGDHIFQAFDQKRDNSGEFYSSLFSQSAYDFLQHSFNDQKLIQVLAGTSLKLDLNPDKLPLYTFAQTNESYIESAWRIKGGGSLVTEQLARYIEFMGGTILKGKEVVSLNEQGGKASQVVLSNGEVISGRFFISNVHPSVTLRLLSESKNIRPAYRKRINGLKNTHGMFTVHIKLKENRLSYLNRNIHIHTEKDVWSHHSYIPNRIGKYLVVSYTIPEEGTYARNIDILTPMYWEEVSQWDGTQVGKRGNDYLEFKQKKAEECIELASTYIPGLKDAVDQFYTSTPLSYQNYTGTPNGSAYGIEKDYNELIYTVISTKTPIENLFLTGQNLNVHGILGVSMTSFLTCGEIIGADTVLNDLNE